MTKSYKYAYNYEVVQYCTRSTQKEKKKRKIKYFEYCALFDMNTYYRVLEKLMIPHMHYWQWCLCQCAYIIFIQQNTLSIDSKENIRGTRHPRYYCISRAGWWISEVCADQVRLKHFDIETTVQKDFAQNSIFWKINFKPKIPYLRN